ncbi:MAG: 23S rRNA (guanosine(2251)-2'-O)-methyltransferase RlmB [bacterium]
MDKSPDELIYGRQPVLEALLASRPLRKILVSRSSRPSGAVRAILDHARQQDIAVQFVDQRRLDELVSGNHQGVVAMASAKPLGSIEQILDAARTSGKPPLVLVLDGVEDPANLGAILRTADGAGVHGVIIPKHRAVGLTGVVARTSAGAIEHVPVAQVTNLVSALEELKAAGLWVVGADPKAPQNLYEIDLTPPLVLVIGGEGKGLRRLVREHCDLLIRLPMHGSMSSLNVAVAAGVLLFEIVRQREARS